MEDRVEDEDQVEDIFAEVASGLNIVILQVCTRAEENNISYS